LAFTNKISFWPFALVKNERKWKPFKRWAAKQSRLYAFSLYAAVQPRWTPEWGYRVQISKFAADVQTLRSTFLSFLKHFEMLGRKINFRRKILKKKFEEYT